LIAFEYRASIEELSRFSRDALSREAAWRLRFTQPQRPRICLRISHFVGAGIAHGKQFLPPPHQLATAALYLPAGRIAQRHSARVNSSRSARLRSPGISPTVYCFFRMRIDASRFFFFATIGKYRAS